MNPVVSPGVAGIVKIIYALKFRTAFNDSLPLAVNVNVNLHYPEPQLGSEDIVMVRRQRTDFETCTRLPTTG